ncbi:zf-TFIIB domain-containing protein [Pokkaliibacter sp. MBI-7]|uniref:zf-TFIIB domain-containing protein n=1 Tax=Pokkaliibacter sp. MBI-7 TaxID=3040600 RepID=UPI00244B9A51|nr:zf-TFIIB domain-containing protein [Pokkaliibacter sp. MBI-7]MDH2433468.1 zf-TFIIB domain-containing protein [Pokkaliibacter sp. MBI-7]
MMKCTSCNQGELKPSFIDSLFRAHTCSHCGGNWILIEDYVTWKERHPEYQFAADMNLEERDAEDSRQALLCPMTGVFMQKFRISLHSSHRLDYSSAVGGLWLDKGEWELLKKEGLAGSLNAVVTPQWQKRLQQQGAKEHFAELYRDKFGEADYARVQEVRAWLQAHPRKADLRAYLLAFDPYSAER